MECFNTIGTIEYVKIGAGYLIFIITLISLTPGLRLNYRTLKLVYILLVTVSICIFAKYVLWNTYLANVANKCSYCSLYYKCFGKESSPLSWKIGGEYFYFIYQYSFFTFPSFIIGTFVAALFSNRYRRIPVNMCSGQEILILKPLQMLGLSIGHQISFTIAATGICLSIIPLYYATFGKKLTGIIVSYFFVSAICIGYLTNLTMKILV